MSEIIIKNFYSKKNQVSLVNRDGLICIRKKFADINDCAAEIEELSNLKALCVPRIIEVVDNCIYMSYIEGELLLDRYLSASKPEMDNLAYMLADFIKSYSKQRNGRCLADLNFRNFIVNEGCLYGVDFENTENGEELNAVIAATAFAVLYDIKISDKAEFIKAFLSRFNFSKNYLIDAISNELTVIKKRRGLTDSSNYIEFLNNLI